MHATAGTRAARRIGGSFCAAALAAVLLAGCAAIAPRPVVTPSYRVTPPPLLTVRPIGSTVAGCDQSRPVGGPPAPDDLHIGPLDYSGLANGYPAQTQEADENGIRFFKSGASLPPDRSVTVTIGAAARDFAGILTEYGRDAGYTSVTYRSCPASARMGTVFWVGGFLLAGRESACVPLEVAVRGEATVRTTSIALPAGACG